MKDVIRQNLLDYTDQAAALDEITSGQLRELAHTALRMIPPNTVNGRDAFLSGDTLRTAFSVNFEAQKNTLAYYTMLAEYCAYGAEIFFDLSDVPLNVDDFIGEHPSYAPGTLSCMQNALTASVIRRFSEVFPFDQIIHADTYAASCEDVDDGVARYCILPLLSPEDGRLFAFNKLCDRYALVPVGTADASTEDSDSILRFALLSRNLSDGLVPKGACYTLYFSDEVRPPLTIARICAALETVGAEIARIDAYPRSYNLDASTFFFVLHTDEAHILPLLTLRAVLLPHAELRGLYRAP